MPEKKENTPLIGVISNTVLLFLGIGLFVLALSEREYMALGLIGICLLFDVIVIFAEEY